jgi:hypothetical protein
MTSRNTLLALLVLGAGAAAAPVAALAQAQAKARRIGFLTPRSRPSPPDRDAFSDAFIQGMRELGYVEAKNVVIQWRHARGNYKSPPIWRPSSPGWISKSSWRMEPPRRRR